MTVDEFYREYQREGRILNMDDKERAAWEPAIEFVLEAEGGYVNDPDDPGGETNFGISKKYNPNVDIKNLTIDEAKEIYYQDYWIPSLAWLFSNPLAMVVFDSAVQHGPQKAVDWLVDSHFDAKMLITLRAAYYDELIRKNPAKEKFRKGWKNRLIRLMEKAHA